MKVSINKSTDIETREIKGFEGVIRVEKDDHPIPPEYFFMFKVKMNDGRVYKSFKFETEKEADEFLESVKRKSETDGLNN